MTLQETKDQYANELFGEDWSNATYGFSAVEIEAHMEDVAKKYAQSKLKEAIDLCDYTEDYVGIHQKSISNIKLD